VVESGLERLGVDLEEEVAGMDELAFLEGDLDDLAVDAGLHDHRLVGLHRADAAHDDGHVLLLGDARCDRNRRRRPGGGGAGPVAAQLVGDEPAGDDQADHQGGEAQPGQCFLVHSDRLPRRIRSSTEAEFIRTL
jgi:hypothetical protein